MAAPRTKLLVVDDDRNVLQLLSDALAEQGYGVVTAAAGLEALLKVSLEKPHAVLLDVHLPDISGLDVLRRIRESGNAVPVLVITGNDDADLAKEAVGLGAHDAILKPLDLEHLARAVRLMLGARSEATGGADGEAATPPAATLVYDLALAILMATRQMPEAVRASMGSALDAAALATLQKSSAGEKPEVVRALAHVRTLIRLSRDLGDLDDDLYRRLEAHVVRARRSVGLS
jgi:DNA-binding response OmpR family regulator